MGRTWAKCCIVSNKSFIIHHAERLVEYTLETCSPEHSIHHHLHSQSLVSTDYQFISEVMTNRTGESTICINSMLLEESKALMFSAGVASNVSVTKPTSQSQIRCSTHAAPDTLFACPLLHKHSPLLQGYLYWEPVKYSL